MSWTFLGSHLSLTFFFLKSFGSVFGPVKYMVVSGESAAEGHCPAESEICRAPGEPEGSTGSTMAPTKQSNRNPS